jgi:hypothetical protein
MAERVSEIVALRKFFGQKPGQTLKDFSDEVRQLSPEEKTELAQLACTELGLELEPK